MPLSLSGGLSLSKVGFGSTDQHVIPAGSIIMYNGTDPKLSGWSQYFRANGRYIKGTTNTANVQAVTNASGSASAALTFTTNGAHTNVGSPYNGTYTAFPGTFGSTPPYGGGPAGDHNHTATVGPAPAVGALPWTSDVTFLLAWIDQTSFPPNTIHIRNAAASGWTQKLATDPGSPTLFNSIRNIRAAPGTQGVADVSASAITFGVTSTNSDGYHSHVTELQTQINPATGTYLGGSSFITPGPSQPSYSAPGLTWSGTQVLAPPGGENHSHGVTSSAYIKNLESKALKLWVVAAESGLLTDTMVMFAGDITNLPPYWKLCDGTNGTVDMNQFFMAHASSAGTAHGAPVSKNITVSGSAATVSWSHNHGYGTGGAPGTGAAFRNIFYHTQGPAPHGHSISTSTVTENIVAPTIELAFIQYIP
jgi:hypothetical protein